MDVRLETRNRDPNNDRRKKCRKEITIPRQDPTEPPSASLPPCIKRCAEERMGADHPEPKQGKTKNKDECWITRITWTGPHDVDLKPQNRFNGTVAAAQSLQGGVRRETERQVDVSIKPRSTVSVFVTIFFITMNLPTGQYDVNIMLGWVDQTFKSD